MKNLRKVLGSLSLITLSLVSTQSLQAQDAEKVVIAGWHFNASSYANAFIPAEFGSGTMYFNGANGSDALNVSTFTGTPINENKFPDTFTIPPQPSQRGAIAFVGTDNNSKYLSFSFSMDKKKNLTVSFATRGTSTGYNSGTWEYSTNGQNWTAIPNAGNTATRSTSFASREFETDVLDGAETAYIRYQLSGASGTSGNNRIDNFVLEAEEDEPLNITLGNVDVKNNGKTNTISWNVLSEDYGDSYVVEKSNDGNNYEALASITGKGIAPTFYEVIDIAPVNGYNYYRIKMINIDGTIAYSKVVFTNNTTAYEEAQVNIYPNPAKDIVNIDFKTDHTNNNGIIKVINSLGRVVYEENINNSGLYQINTSNWVSNMYYFILINGNTVKSFPINIIK